MDSTVTNVANMISTNTKSTLPTKSVDKNVTDEKDDFFIHTILLAIICLLLLAVISISCCYSYTRHLIKKG